MREKLTSGRWLAVVALALVAAAAAGGALAAFPDTNVVTYTGCLNTGGSSGGQISQLTTGLSPLKPCGSNQQLIHLGGGDITKVSAGSGLTGGGDTGAVTLSLSGGYQLPQSCADGQAPKESGGSWTCGNFANSDQSCASGNFANSIGSDGSLACAAPPAPSTSHAYFAKDYHVIDVDDGAVQDVVTLTGLPAGTYLVWATVLNDGFGDNPDSLYCSFENGSGDLLQPWPAAFSVPLEGNEFARSDPFTVAGATSLPSNGELVLKCGVNGDTGASVGDNRAYGSITALKVDALN